MTVGRDPNGKTWYFVIDLPPGPDGRRRQMRRRGFANERVAAAEKQAALRRFSGASLAAHGTVAAELKQWLDEREIDMSITGLSSYRDFIRAYVNPHIGGLPMFSLDRDAIHGLYKTLLRSGELAGLRWSKVDLVRGVVRTDWQRTTATGQGGRGVVDTGRVPDGEVRTAHGIRRPPWERTREFRSMRCSTGLGTRTHA